MRAEEACLEAFEPRMQNVSYVVERDDHPGEAEVAMVLVRSARRQIGVSDLVDVEPILGHVGTMTNELEGGCGPGEPGTSTPKEGVSAPRGSRRRRGTASGVSRGRA